MKRAVSLIVIFLTICCCELFAESKTIYEKSRGLSCLRFYENESVYYIYAEELKEYGQRTIILIRSLDKQKLSDVVVSLLDNEGIKGNFLNNLQKLDYVTFEKKETKFSKTQPEINIYYYYYME